MTRPFAGPPGLPQDRLVALRKALLDMNKYSAFIDETRKTGSEYSPMSGEEIVADLTALYQTPKHVVEKATEATSKP